MKIDKNLMYGNPYMNMSFKKLADMVFTEGGDKKDCDPAACAALILRLENCWHMDGFGNAATGELNELEAFIFMTIVLRKGLNV